MRGPYRKLIHGPVLIFLKSLLYSNNMRMIIPYASLIYTSKDYAGGRRQYLKNLLFMISNHQGSDKCLVYGAPSDFQKEFFKDIKSDEPLKKRIIWKYLLGNQYFFNQNFYDKFLEIVINKSSDDVIHFPFGPICFDARFISPTVVTIHEVYHETITPILPIQERMRRRYLINKLRQTDYHIITVSEFIKKELINNYLINESRITVIQPGCHPIHYQDYEKDYLENVKRIYRLPDNFIFYPAVKWPFKNHINLVRAISLLREKNFPNLHLVLTGSWPIKNNHYMRSLKEEFSKLKWILDFDYVPSSHIPAFYRLASAIAFPSLTEGFGIPIMEAMANGCPVICSDIEVFREMAQNAAVFINPLDLDHLAEAISRVLTRDNSFFVEKGKEVANNFSLDKISQKLFDFYQSISG